jgi:Protein of unknown function (DUF1566)
VRAVRALLSLLVAAATSAAFAEQTCDIRNYPLSSPSARFEDNGDGTVTDRQTRLMWMRCSIGQAWSSGTCAGQVAGQTLASAQDAAQQVNQRGTFFYADWRVPQIHELATITERQCENPRINLQLFPSTPAGFYWTATSRPDKTPQPSAFALSFGAGGVRYESKAEANHARLVRSAQ